MGQAPADGVAIIGMHVRVPGAADLGTFWNHLRDGVESLRTLDRDELLAAGEDPARLDDPAYVPVAGTLDDVDAFDASFFGYSPREAALIDPQQRLFLESAWAALEHAGHDPSRFPGDVGVYASASLDRYLVRNLLPSHADVDDHTTLHGNDKDFLATRVSYHLGLTGPSATLQCGCSSSLVAVATATSALLTHQCDMALAGGVSLRLPQARGYVHVPEGILSPDGRCRPFDAEAGGTCFSSGVGVVVLRRLEDALADGDPIHAVIRGVAVNNDGDQKLGFTAPSLDRQAAVVAQAQALAGVDAQTVGFVEAHGTGTALGDPVEVAALTQAFRVGGERVGYCALGSVKGNLGHLDVASGVIGLVKATLALKRRVIPPTVHFRAPHPALDLEHSPFYVNSEAREWTTDGRPRRAGVTSLGVGGTNAHVVLQEAPEPEPSTPGRPHQLLPLSARTPQALAEIAGRLAVHVERHPQNDLADVAHTLQVGRRALPHRRALVCADREQAVRMLSEGEGEHGEAADATPDVAFLFPGQGAQHAGMGRALYDTEPVYRHHVDDACARLEPHLGLDLRTLLHPVAGAERDASERLRLTSLAQPALFVVEHALARLWMEWGLRPDAFLGHSLGELVAACISQVFRLEHALELVAVRGRLMEAQPSGAMLSVPLAPADLEPRLGGELALAAVNSPGLSTVSGPEPAIARLQDALHAEGLGSRRLEVSHAFHSPMMDPVVEAFTEAVARVPRKPPETPFVSNVTGTWITAQEAVDPGYWGRQLRGTVRFRDGLELLAQDPGRVLLEVGPGVTLTTLAQEGRGDVHAVSSLAHPSSAEPETASLHQALGRLWLAGVPIDWDGYAQHERRRRLPLPTYPFARERHWVDEHTAGDSSASVRAADPGRWFFQTSWRRASAPPRSSPAPAVGTARWLVLADGEGRCDGLPEALRAAGHEVVVARPGAAFAQQAPDAFLCDPSSGADLDRLLAALGGARPTHVALLGLAGSAALADEAGYVQVMAVADALERTGDVEPLSLCVVTRGAQDVTGEAPDPARAAALGACRVLPQERPRLTVRALDLAPGEGDLREIAWLAEELLCPATDELVARRGGHRWVADLAPVALPAADELAGVRDGAVCVVFGGRGGVGRTLAAHLARVADARLVLCGRRPWPARETWDDLIADGGADALALDELRQLEASGTELELVVADVTRADDVAAACAHARERFGAVHVVIHAAGLAAEGLAREPTDELPTSALAPKLAGTRHVLDALGDDTDLVVLCSSVSSVLGGVGQADYCAGNLAMDALAAGRAPGTRPRVVSIGWDTWSEVGMAAEAVVPEALRARQRRVLAQGLSRDEGVEVFRRVLASSLSHVLVSTTPLPARRAQLTLPEQDIDQGTDTATPRDRRGAAPADAAESSGSGAAPQAAAPAGPAAAVDRIEADVVRVWTQLLGIRHAGPDDGFFEQGGNSLLATQMLARLRERYANAELSLAALFAEPTLGSLVRSIRRTHGHEERGAPASAVAPPDAAHGAARSASPPGALRAELIAAAPAERRARLEAWLRDEVGAATGRSADALPADGRLDGLDPTLVSAHLASVMVRELGVPIYAPEIREQPTLGSLARLVDEEFSRLALATSPTALAGREAGADAPPRADLALILSSPRSGSTLLRLMLSAHPGLFCPPELFLLDNDGMAGWNADPFAAFYRDGLVRAFMGREDLAFEEAQRLVDELVSRDAPVGEVYARLRGGHDGLLVDKTPTYALNRTSLDRGEALFERPLYVGLVRHPLSVIDSFVRNRLDRIRRMEGDAHDLAERTWRDANRNLLEHGRRVGAERFHLVRFERLVREPEAVLRGVCAFLGVPYDPQVLQPYEHGRMLGGPGDPNIHRRTEVDPALADAWRAVRLPRPLAAATARLAQRLDYELPA